MKDRDRFIQYNTANYFFKQSFKNCVNISEVLEMSFLTSSFANLCITLKAPQTTDFLSANSEVVSTK